MPKKLTKSLKLNKLTITTTLVIFALVLLSVFFLWSPPKTAAQEYLEAVSEDFYLVQTGVADYQGDFENVSEAMDAFVENFYGLNNRLKYPEALTKSQDDVRKSEELIVAIQEARETKDALELPEGFEELNTLLDEYYNSTENLVQKYLEKKEFQLMLMDAYGQELDENVSEAQASFNTLLNIDPSQPEIPSGQRELTISYDTLKKMQANYQRIADLSSQSLIKMQAITEVPEEDRVVYDTKKGGLQVLNDYAKNSLVYLNQETIPGVQSYVALTFEFSKSMIAREDKMFENVRSQVFSVETVSQIQNLADLDEKIRNEFVRLSVDNEVEIEITPEPSSSPSATLDPSISPDMSPAASPEASADPVPDDESTPSVDVIPN